MNPTNPLPNPTDSRLAFGVWMKIQRKRLDLTQAALAQQIGCAAVTIKQIESGQRRPSRQIVALLTTALEIPVAEQVAFLHAARTPPASTAPAAAEAMPLATSPGTSPETDAHGHGPLPLPATPFIGRQQQLASLQSHLLRPDVRLLTLLGPPGVGKTRLSMQLAASVQDHFADGVVFVPLAPLRLAEQVLTTVGRALGYQEGAGSELVTRLQRYLKDRQLLLVLDNFEHVTEAAPLLGKLLSRAPHLKIVTTSRVPLRLYGEHEVAVSPLALPPLNPLPPLAELRDYPAVALFIARAQAVTFQFQLDAGNRQAVAELCHRLDGLPLAIELAAGRLRALTPQMLLERMANRLHLLTGGARDLPARHQTLVNAIDWSYNLLSPLERRVLRQLAVFAGGWTLAAAEAVIDMGPDPAGGASLLDILTALVSHSLVVMNQHAAATHYHLLESIREYALARLSEWQEDVEVRQRHAEYYFSLVDDPEFLQTQEQAWIDRLEGEMDNLRVALTWVVQHTPERIVQFADELGWFWHERGYLNEGRRWLEQARAQATNLSVREQSCLLAMIGFMAREMNDLATAQALLEESLRGYQALSDEAGQADILNRLAMVAVSYGDYIATDRLTSQSIAIYRRIGRGGNATGPLLLAGEAAFVSHDYERAQIAYSESLRLANELGLPHSALLKMIRLGQIAQVQGAPDQAVAQILAALRLASQINHKWGMIMAFTGLANVAVTLNKSLLAARLLAAVDRHLTRAGMRLWPVDNRQYEQAMTAVRAQLDAVAFERAWASGGAASLEELVAACEELERSDFSIPLRNTLTLTLFGSPEVHLHGQPVTGFRTSKAQALLYYLAVTGRPHTRPALAGLLWGDQPEEAARASLSKCLSNLRDLLGDAITIERQSVAFNRSHSYNLDTEQFEAGTRHTPTATTIDTLQAALALYRGDFLEGFYVRDAPEFEQWLLIQRAHYREAAIYGLQQLADWRNQQGDLSQAITSIRRLLTLEPWREEAHRQLMRLLARSGQRAAALAQFEACRKILDEELAVEPDAETLALVETIRAGEFADTERRRQEGKKSDKASFTLSSPPLVSSSLPIPHTPLIGRERELAGINTLLDDPYCRLLTILGAGGMGKSRLALAIAEQSLANGRWRDGVCLVALAGIDDVQALLPTLLTALALPPESRQGSVEKQKRHLLTFLADKEILLIFDNFEQILEGRTLLSELLASVSGLHLLVTSRERLHLRAEQVYPLSGLVCPVTVADGQAPALALLQYIARRNQPHFQADENEQRNLVHICQLTSGMPLALELAAGWLHLLPSAAIAEALQVNLDLLATTLADVPARHRSVRAVFATTWQFLSAEEGRRLAYLSVFRSGFTYQAAQHVAGATLIQLNRLVDKSLLDYHRTSERYEIHELLRQYSLEQLSAWGEVTTAQQRHARYFLEMAEQSADEVRGPRQKEWLDRLDGEIDNIRAALGAMLAQEPLTALQLATALGPFFRRRRIADGWQWLPLALTAVPEMSPLRARALMFAGSLARLNDQPTQARQLLEESVSFWRSQDDPDNLAQALRHLGWVYYSLDPRQSLLCFEESVALFRQIGDQQRIGQSLTDLAHLIDEVNGDHAKAAHCATEALALMRVVGDQSGIASALLTQAEFMDLQGDYTATAPLYEEALKLFQFLDNKRGLVGSLVSLAENCLFRHEYIQSRSYADQALALVQKMLGKDSLFLLLAWHHLGLAELALGDDRQAQSCLAESLRLARQYARKKMVARSLAGLGGVAVARQQWSMAVCQLSAAYRQFDQEPPFLAPADHQLYQRWIDLAHSQMNDQQFADEWAHGQTITLEEVTHKVLELIPSEA